jgi:hypothetical protein
MGSSPFEESLYKVLSLEPVQELRSGQVSVAEVLRKALGGQPGDARNGEFCCKVEPSPKSSPDGL